MTGSDILSLVEVQRHQLETWSESDCGHWSFTPFHDLECDLSGLILVWIYSAYVFVLGGIRSSRCQSLAIIYDGGLFDAFMCKVRK